MHNDVTMIQTIIRSNKLQTNHFYNLTNIENIKKTSNQKKKDPLE